MFERCKSQSPEKCKLEWLPPGLRGSTFCLQNTQSWTRWKYQKPRGRSSWYKKATRTELLVQKRIPKILENTFCLIPCKNPLSRHQPSHGRDGTMLACVRGAPVRAGAQSGALQACTHNSWQPGGVNVAHRRGSRPSSSIARPL